MLIWREDEAVESSWKASREELRAVYLEGVEEIREGKIGAHFE